MRFHDSAVLAMVLLDRHSSVVHAMPQGWSDSYGSERINGDSKRELAHEPVPVLDTNIETRHDEGDVATSLDLLDERADEFVPPYELAKWRWYMETYLITVGCVLTTGCIGSKLIVRFTNQRQRDGLYACMARVLPVTEDQARDGVHALQDAQQIVMDGLAGGGAKRSAIEGVDAFYDDADEKEFEDEHFYRD